MYLLIADLPPHPGHRVIKLAIIMIIEKKANTSGLKNPHQERRKRSFRLAKVIVSWGKVTIETAQI